MPPEIFLDKLNSLYLENSDLKDGYAPFCKHLFVENFTDCKTYYLPITENNTHLL